MMARTMKASGVDWIGDIPDHWDVKRLKSVCTKIKTVALCTDKYIGLEHVESWSGSYSGVSLNNENPTTYQFVEENTFCFSKLRPYLAKGFFASEKLATSTEFLAYSIEKGMWPRYFLYFTLSAAFIENINNIAGGAKMPRINSVIFENQIFTKPSTKEQIAIAAYLDDRTTAIDSKIQLLEEKSTALSELRKSVIHQAVTKGLDLTVPMKASGVDWIGDIPVSCSVKRLKDIADIKKGDVFPNIQETQPLYPYFNGGKKPSGWSDKFNALENTVAVSEGGASAGYVHFLTTKYWAGSHCYKVRALNNTNVRYMYYVFKGFEEQFMLAQTGSAMPNLQKTKFMNLVVSIVQDREEQIAIAQYLDDRTTIIDESIKTIAEQIVALKSLRQSLIHEAVTGKIDVADFGYKTV